MTCFRRCILITLALHGCHNPSFASHVPASLTRYPVDFAVRYAQRSPSGLPEPRQRKDGRLLASCQLPAGVLPKYAITQIAYEAGWLSGDKSFGTGCYQRCPNLSQMICPLRGRKRDPVLRHQRRALFEKRGGHVLADDWHKQTSFRGPGAHRACACLRIGAGRPVYILTTLLSALSDRCRAPLC